MKDLIATVMHTELVELLVFVAPRILEIILVQEQPKLLLNVGASFVQCFDDPNFRPRNLAHSDSVQEKVKALKGHFPFIRFALWVFEVLVIVFNIVLGKLLHLLDVPCDRTVLEVVHATAQKHHQTDVLRALTLYAA